MRVGQKQKKIDISIPKLDDFIHKVYINVARKVYKNVYLFELNIPPLQTQKNNRELEILVQEGILNTLRESVPVETILRAYMDETVEEDVVEEVKEQIIDEPIQTNEPSNQNHNGHVNNDSTNATITSENSSRLKFDDNDYIRDDANNVVSVSAPKSIERLEEISELRNQQRKSEDEDEDNDENMKLQISDQSFQLDTLDVESFEEPKMELLPDLLIDDIEILE
jgi:hypothetical protein